MNNFNSYFIDPKTDERIFVNVIYTIHKGRKETLNNPAEEASAEIDVFINGTNFSSYVPDSCYERLQRRAMQDHYDKLETDYSKE